MPAWGDLLTELQPHIGINGAMVAPLNLDQLRAKYIKKLNQKTGRNVIAYYSGWLKPGKTYNVEIIDADITGFMNAIRGMDCEKGLDLILHTPGGSPTATEGIVKYLHTKFGNNIRAIIPQMAMSAGTMLACSAKEIMMGTHSCLGPIDPQYNGVPAYNILQEFQDAKEDIESNGASKEYWELALRKYPFAFYYAVNDAITLSSVLVREWLKKYMFSDLDKKDANIRTNRILKKLNSNNKSHSRHFTYDDCKKMGLNVVQLEGDQELQELVLSVHHAFIISFDGSNATKIIENQNESRYIMNQNMR